MRVTLAYVFDGHLPDETVDLPDADARRLLSDGRARHPEQTAPPPTTRKRGPGRKEEA